MITHTPACRVQTLFKRPDAHLHSSLAHFYELFFFCRGKKGEVLVHACPAAAITAAAISIPAAAQARQQGLTRTFRNFRASKSRDRKLCAVPNCQLMDIQALKY